MLPLSLKIFYLTQDDPESANSEILFNMKNAEVGAPFRIETVGTGMARIFPATSLKGKYGNYSVTVSAQDRGEPQNVREATYHICVQV